MSSSPKTAAPASHAEALDLEERLRRLEQKLELGHFPSSAPDASGGKLRDLAATVHDLARQQQTLRRDLESLFEALEAGQEDLASTVATQAPFPRSATLDPADSFARRAARWLLRNTLGRARALWQAADPQRPPFLELSVVPGTPVSGPLRISGGAGVVAESIETQTSPPVLLEQPSDDPSAYRLLEAPTTRAPLLRTVWELLAWTLATERLAFLELRLGAGARILLAAEPSSGAAVGKSLSLPRTAPRRSLGPELAPAFRPSTLDRYSVPRKGTPPRLHPIAPLQPPTGGQRPGRQLLLLEAPLDRDVAEWCATRMHTHGGPEGWLLVSTVPSDAAQVRRLLGFEALGALGYPLADFFEPETSGSVLETLFFLYSVAAVTRLGEGPSPWLSAVRKDLELHDFDLLEPEGLPFEVSSPGSSSPAGARLRQELGVEPGEILVVQTCDLERFQRPQDFLLLAHHLREDPRFFFLLCGEGANESTVADLEGYLRLSRYRRLTNPPRVDLLTAADVVTSTAERLPLPYDLAAALAIGRPVVAAEAPGLERLDGVRLCPVGDLAGLAEALQDTARSTRPRPA